MFQPSPPCSAAPWHFSKTSWLFSSCPSPSICSSVKARQFFLKWRKNDWMISQQSSQKMVGMHLPLGSHSKNPTKFQGFCQGFSSHLNVMSAWFVQRPLPSSPVYLFTESRRTNRSVHMLALHQKSFSLVKRLRPILMNPHFESHAYRIYYFTIICIC